MRNATSLLALVALAALLTAGCAGPEQRLGNGINNLTEFAHLGEIRLLSGRSERAAQLA